MKITRKIKKDFPILSRKINNESLVYLDNSATTQCPLPVIDSISDYYKNHKANVHRGVHTLSEESTQMYEDAKITVAKFINAAPSEIVFIKNETEGANLVAFSFFKKFLKKGDTILLSEFEHHSNILPWTREAKNLGLNVQSIPFNSDFTIDLNKIKEIDFKFLAINHVSNFLGNINPVIEIAKICKQKQAYFFVDGAQAIAHLPVDVKKIGCDFYSISSHKIYGPFGSGALYIRENLVDKMDEFCLGGGMILEVSLNKSSFITGVEKYDAGTPNVADAVAFATALNYFSKLGKENIFKHENEILKYLYNFLSSHKLITVYGPLNLENRAGLVSFNVKNIHSHDLASVLDTEGVAIRSGQHCTMPAHKNLKINSSARASLALYNFKEDVDKLMFAIEKAIKLFS